MHHKSSREQKIQSREIAERHARDGQTTQNSLKWFRQKPYYLTQLTKER